MPLLIAKGDFLFIAKFPFVCTELISDCSGKEVDRKWKLSNRMDNLNPLLDLHIDFVSLMHLLARANLSIVAVFFKTLQFLTTVGDSPIRKFVEPELN